MPIHPKGKPKNNSPEDNFEALKLLNLQPSNAGELLINNLATERVNAVSWDKLTSNSDKFNGYLKENKWFWEKLYLISRESLKGEFPCLIVIAESNQIIPAKIISIVRSAITRKIFNAIVLVDIIKWKNSDWKVTWEFNSLKSNVITNIEFISGNDPNLTIEEKQKFLKEEGYEFPVKEIDKKNIPLIEWRSLPDNEIFYEQAQEKAETLSRANDIYIDQLLNAMTKRVEVDTSQTTGTPATAEEKNAKNLIFKTISLVKSSTLDEFDKVQAMYQPNAASIQAFRDNVDWLEEKIKNLGKSLKDDDKDSAQKSEIELININRSATDALELNLSMWTKSLEELIAMYDKTRADIRVNLELRTIGTMMKEKAENIGIEDLKGVNNGTE